MRNLVLLLLSFVVISNVKAQDTLKVTLPELERRFVEKNLLLIATHTNVDIAKAFTEQAKLWDNPNILFETGMANFQDKKVFDGQQEYALVQQIFRLAQKRQKLVSLSKAGEQLSEAQFKDLMRALRHQLRSDFYDIANINQKKTWYESQITGFAQLVNAVSSQVTQGNMAQKDLVRLQSQTWQLQRELADLERSKIIFYTDLQTLIGEKNAVVIAPQTDPLSIDTEKSQFPDLLNTALQNRTDLKILEANKSVQQANVIYQKALAKPDLTVGMVYDRVNSYTPNYVGLQLGVPIPILNKNQGNIHAAELLVKQQDQQRDAVATQISSEITSAFMRMKELERWQKTQAEAFYTKYESFYKQVTDSYQKKQITLVEFIDFFQDYQQQKLQQLEHESLLRQAVEDLNFAVGKDVY
jgi:outer membrane protein, heavy metal efflux system